MGGGGVEWEKNNGKRTLEWYVYYLLHTQAVTGLAAMSPHHLSSFLHDLLDAVLPCVRSSGVADRHGVHPPALGRGAARLRDGVQPVQDAAAPRHQGRVRRLAGLGRHPRHRTLQGEVGIRLYRAVGRLAIVHSKVRCGSGCTGRCGGRCQVGPRSGCWITLLDRGDTGLYYATFSVFVVGRSIDRPKV